MKQVNMATGAGGGKQRPPDQKRPAPTPAKRNK